MIELRIQGQAVDVAPDTKITLNFNSNIFGDISKITPSNSLTIALPKTPKNAKVFGAPSVVGGSSIAPYRRWNAELYVNGVAMVDTAYAVLLSVGESYEIALYWGVVTALSTLKDNGKTLADINQVLEIKYGGENWWSSWEGAYGRTTNGAISANLINAVYESGIEDLRNNATARAQVALLPSVKVLWLWNRIVADNGLTIEKPSQFTQALGELALPFTTHKVNKAIEDKCEFLKVNYRTTSANGPYIGKATFYTLRTTPAVNPYSEYEQKVVSLKMNNRSVDFDAVIYRAKQAHTATFTLMLTVEKSYEIGSYWVGFELYNSEGIAKYTNLAYENSHAEQIETTQTFELSEGDYVVATAEGIFKDITILSSTMIVDVAASEENQVMGGMINTRDNLPDISQLDFVKALCEMYGLWATLIDGVVHLVSFADLYAQTPIDWSHKLVGTGDGDAGNITYTLADYAKRNILRYKEDDTVKVDASGALVVDNDNLDREKDMLTLPFSASDGNVIPHLKWKDDVTNGEVEEQNVEPRIMTLKDVFGLNSHTASLSFDGLKFSQLIPEYYAFWQKIMRNPIVIEEKVRLSEIDIKMLDFRKPIYLQKYGAQFAIDKVQWSEGEPSTVTLVKLPPANDIGVAFPYKVTTGVAYGVGIGGGVDAEPSLSYLVSGAGEYFAESATIRFNEQAGANVQLSFKAWVSSSGRTISTDNPYIYDGSNGDLEIIAMTEESLVG